MPPLRTLMRLILGTPVPAAPRRRRRSAPDFQRSKVYRWEGRHVLPRDTAALSLDECRALVLAAYRWAEAPAAGDHDWTPPLVTDGRGRRHACGSRAVIKLPRWARTRPVVLHECAHGLAPDKHGPRFVAVYVALIEQFMGLPRAALEESLAEAGIAFGKVGRSRDGALLSRAPSPARAAARQRPAGN
ncbi:hypothetical protein SH611_22710 [Geminicoccaceae bacterium 1502E]|nr:hypothetical protein [Geminicoccaceae bacterium 1502E]